MQEKETFNDIVSRRLRDNMKVVTLIIKYFVMHPEIRFSQFISNAFGDGDYFYEEPEKTHARLKEYIESRSISL